MPALQYCRINVNCLIDVTVRSVHPILILMVILTAVLSVGGLLPHATVRADEFNYDESRVPEFTLPDPLVTLSGEPVTTVEQWNETRRPEILRLFEEHVFGKLPEGDVRLRTKLRSETSSALNGLAHRREITVYFTDDDSGPKMDLLVYTPRNAAGKVPAFLGYNFNGNHAIEHDRSLHMTESWVRNNKQLDIENNRTNEAARGAEASRWAAGMIVSRGYGLVTIYYGDVDPDFDDGFRNGIHSLFETGDSPRAGDAGGSISAWAWGLSRALDVLQEDSRIDASAVAVFGHSRLGKTSLWAGACDPRFAMVIANESGCGGAALSRRRFGETVKRINTSFPHWFCLNHRLYNDNEQALPVDHHMLVALSAPRPVYVASAEEDRWADPRGEFLSVYHAGPVYSLLGRRPLTSDAMPGVNSPVMTDVAYHVRSGVHDVTDYDWEQYLRFADIHLRPAATGSSYSAGPGARIDGTGPGWRLLGQDDFVNVNCADDTWSFPNGEIHCTGSPVGVMRLTKEITNFELVVEWRHLRSAGNSGVFLWATEESLAALKPGGLPAGIEVQILDHGYTENYRRQTGKEPDWFTTNGDVFPTGNASMKPFPPVSANGSRSFPSRSLSHGVGEWNHYYIRAINGEVRLWVNGEEVSGGTECRPASGFLCLESEGSPIEFRGLRIRELP